MYLHKLKKPNGDMYLTIKEKYHVPKTGAREKTIKSIGYVSALNTLSSTALLSLIASNVFANDDLLFHLVHK